MDELKKGLKNISLYDVKSYVRKAQNVVYNYTEMEARVREATNNEPWGASSTLMAKIAAGTYNFREREEIIGMVFRRFTEKAANEWRQIYKSLQLLEYLCKNGSERFVDDTRANLSLITMLRSFHYIDSHGKDQGINVRAKAKSLVELLNNDTNLRAERKKARENTKKFQGVAGGAKIGNENDYDDYETYENRIFGDGGVYGQQFEEARSTGQSSNQKTKFEEYDVEPKQQTTNNRQQQQHKPVPSKPVEQDLFSFGDDDTPTASTSAAADDDFDDDFGDFQGSATTNTTGLNNLSNLYHQSQPQQLQFDSGFGDFTSNQSSTQPHQPSFSTTTAITGSFSSGPAPAAKNDAFSSLFANASTMAHKNSGASGSVSQSRSASMHQPQQFSQPSASTTTQQQQQQQNNGEVSLLDL